VAIGATQQTKQNKTVRLALGVLFAIAGTVAAVVNIRFMRDKPYRDHFLRGAALMEASRPEEAEAALRAALSLNPDKPEPYRLLSQLYLDTQHADLAIPLLERLRVIAPQTPNTLSNLAEAYAITGEEDKALETARQAVALEPNNPRAHALLGVTLGTKLETKTAIASLQKAYSLAPTDNKIALSLAQACLDGSDLEAAEKVAREVIARDPKYATAYYTLGRSYSRRTPTPENLKEGIAAFEKALEMKPEWGDAYSELGRMRLNAGDTKGAIAALEFVWNKGGRTEDAAFHLGNAYRKVGQIAKADALGKEFKRLSQQNTKYEALRKRVTIDPNNVDAAIELGELEMDRKGYNDAQMLLEGALRARPKDVRALNAVIKLYKSTGNGKLATPYEQRLAALKTN
jgi:tetratricopeptide (TPR) repeat protein